MRPPLPKNKTLVKYKIYWCLLSEIYVICFEESNINNDIKNLSNKKTNNIKDYSFSSNPNINIKNNLFTQNNKIIKDQQQSIKQTNSFMRSPHIYPKILFQNNTLIVVIVSSLFTL